MAAKLVNLAIVEYVARNPGTTCKDIELAMGSEMLLRDEATQAANPSTELVMTNWFAGGSYFYARLDRMVKDGHLSKLLVKGTNRYYPAQQFDLSDATIRQCMADLIEDSGDEKLAEHLRLAHRGK